MNRTETPVSFTRPLAVFLTISLLIISSAIFLVRQDRPTKAVPTTPLSTPTLGTTQPADQDDRIPADPITKKAMEDDAYLFWNTHLEKTFSDLFKGKCNFPLIAEKYSELNKMTVDRHHKEIERHIFPLDDKRSPDIMATGGVIKGVPTVTLMIPAMKRMYDRTVSSHGAEGEELFQKTILICFLHELDHLAYNFVWEGDVDKEVILQCEKSTWAKTCENTIAPLVEKYHVRLGDTEMLWYQLWIDCGRDPNNPKWDAVLRAAHSPVMTHR